MNKISSFKFSKRENLLMNKNISLDNSMVNSKITGFNMVSMFINHQYILVPLNLKELFLTVMDLGTEH